MTHIKYWQLWFHNGTNELEIAHQNIQFATVEFLQKYFLKTDKLLAIWIFENSEAFIFKLAVYVHSLPESIRRSPRLRSVTAASRAHIFSFFSFCARNAGTTVI